MSGDQWLAIADPAVLLYCLPHRLSDRKFRLFACACYRHLWHLLKTSATRRSVEIAELFADGLTDPATMAAAHHAANAAEGQDWYRYPPPTHPNARQAAAIAARSAADAQAEDDLLLAFLPVCEPGRTQARRRLWNQKRAAARGQQATLLRDITGYPFRPVAVDPHWLAWDGGIIPRLAQSIYDGRRYDELPILADALEDAGCENDDILGHLRDPCPHVRGCWVVDLLLGRE